MTVVAIHQPQYLPWQPYLAKAMACDVFVYLDTVQFQKDGVQNRNMIKTANGPRWLTVPVHASLKYTIAETQLADARWVRKHLATIRQSYRGAPSLDWFDEVLAPCLSLAHASLAELTIRVTDHLLDRLGARCRRIRASELSGVGTREELVIDLARKVGATRYLSGLGAMSYQSPATFAREGIALTYIRHRSRPYLQRHASLGFVDELSALDLLLNLSQTEARAHVEDGTIVEDTTTRELGT